MPITVHIPSPPRQFAGNRAAITVDAVATVGDLFDYFAKEYPSMRERICEADGKLRRFVNVYVLVGWKFRLKIHPAEPPRS